MPSVRENLSTLLQERANTWQTTGKPLADIAAEREFTADEAEKFERASQAFEQYGQRIKALQLTYDQERTVAQFAEQLADDPQVRTAFETELRAILRGSQRETEISFTGKDVTRALGTTTAASGGASVPTTMLSQLIVALRNTVSVLDAGATVLTTGSGENIAIPRLATFGAAAVQTQGQQLTGTDPTFDQVSLGAYKFGDFRGVNRELIEDSVVDIEALVTNIMASNIGLLMAQKLEVGTGTGETRGVATSAVVGVTGAAGVGGAMNVDNAIDLYYSVPAPYRRNAAWLIADAALAGIRKLKDTTGQYLWAPSVQVGQPDLLLGRPVHGSAFLTAPAAAATSAVFGDMSAYWVRIVNGLRIERSDQALFGSDQIAFRGVIRADGGLVDPSAVRSFKGGAAT